MNTQTTQEILANLPPGTTRVYVKDITGTLRYKPVAEVVEEDEIQLRPSDGAPMVWQSSGGRPPKAATILASGSGLTYQVKLNNHIRQDNLANLIKKDPEDSKVLSQIVVEIGADIARLDFLRAELQPNRTNDAVELTTRRIKALSSLHQALEKQHSQKGVAALDPSAPGVREAVRFAIESVRQSMVKVGLRPEVMESVFTLVSKQLAEKIWEDQLRARMQKATLGGT